MLEALQCVASAVVVSPVAGCCWCVHRAGMKLYVSDGNPHGLKVLAAAGLWANDVEIQRLQQDGKRTSYMLHSMRSGVTWGLHQGLRVTARKEKPPQ